MTFCFIAILSSNYLVIKLIPPFKRNSMYMKKLDDLHFPTNDTHQNGKKWKPKLSYTMCVILLSRTYYEMQFASFCA